MSVSKRKCIPDRVKQKIRSQPCAVCGVPYSIHVDHIKPLARGGSNGIDNLQPLCSTCNMRKNCWWTNDDLATWVMGRGVSHFIDAVYRHDTRFTGPYGGPSVAEWVDDDPSRIRFAAQLHADFQAKMGVRRA